ncbi:IclR family transcriptional regulator [Gordonia sp. NB41Y]|uniref:IclR family transcriptional regulator n=1 Tax=Gordonia sp. NB41Y TaxID=875808 RepID=UPI00034C01A4|nr:IclR family transcriptional regulator [Gordonia sp. NB41Y]EMP15003.2 IclR family transcriptional regulator [Gordonia sp. NB41Y]WLP88764.1 IclR family transcriptional regulator [Gordonia sp. NB41Y]
MAALQTVQKIGPVLDLFTVGRPEWGVSEVANEIGLPRSSAHALLASLVDIGLLQCRSRGRYRIGWRIVELNQTLQGTVDVKTCAAPILQNLSEKYGETTHLAILDRYRVMYVDKVVGNHVINVSGARIGAHLDAHCSAVGKAMLAHCHPTEIDRNVTNAPLRRLTPNTITDPSTLHAELKSVLRQGCAYDLGEAISEVHCVAAPIRDEMGVVVAAISITAPVSRFTAAQHEFRRSVISAAGAVTKALGSALPAPAPVEVGNPTLHAVAG